MLLKNFSFLFLFGEKLDGTEILRSFVKKSFAGKLVPLSFGFGFGFGPPRNRRIRECRRIFFAQSDDIKLALSQAAWLSILKENQWCCTSMKDLIKDTLLMI